MPIEFSCDCGKQLRVDEQYAGKKARCPSCQGVVQVPAVEAEPEADFEYLDVEEAPSPPKPKKAVAIAKPVPKSTRRYEDDEDEDEEERPRRRRSRYEDDDEDDDEDDRPRRRRSRYEDDDEEDVRPSKRKKSGPPKSKYRKKLKKADKENRSLEGGILNGGVVGGVIAMLIAVVWFVAGLIWMDRIFFYPPILFIIGLVGLIKGMVGGGDDE